MISFIGMRTQEVVIKPSVSVVLKVDSETLDEVIVVAYGTAKKASFTGSASVMKAGEMSAPKQSLVKSLEGKVAGVRVGASTGDPGADQNILIRGISSISASSAPLYVIDGVPVSSDGITSGLKSQSVLASINPDDIESMTILKDAAASSLYGSRAANGVIIITTKRGKEGKTKITYNMETGWTQMAIGDQYTPMNAAQAQEYYANAVKNWAELNPETADYYSNYYFVSRKCVLLQRNNDGSYMYFHTRNKCITIDPNDLVVMSNSLGCYQCDKYIHNACDLKENVPDTLVGVVDIQPIESFTKTNNLSLAITLINQYNNSIDKENEKVYIDDIQYMDTIREIDEDIGPKKIRCI